MAVRVIVLDEGLYTGSGMVQRWARRVAREMYLDIAEETPVRSGALKRSLRVNPPSRVGRRQVATSVSVSADHAMYVLRGTAHQGRRFIYSDGGWAAKAYVDRIVRTRGNQYPYAGKGLYMSLRDGRGPKYLLRVRGQRANNFMLAGYNETARRHPALRQLSPRYIRVR